MVMALGKLREARDKGREEGRQEGPAEGRVEGRVEGRAEEYEAMIQALREAGISESDIQRVQAQRDARGNGPGEG
jgi:flagellar biosynthesis/type III secretory pathway protein FliH